MKKLLKTLAFSLLIGFQMASAANEIPIINENTIFDVDDSGNIFLYTIDPNMDSLIEILDKNLSENGDHAFSYGVSNLIELKWKAIEDADGKKTLSDQDKSSPFQVTNLSGEYEKLMSVEVGHPNYDENEKFISGIRDELYQSNARLSNGEIINFGGLQLEGNETSGGDTEFLDKNNFFYKNSQLLYNGQKVCPVKRKCKSDKIIERDGVFVGCGELTEVTIIDPYTGISTITSEIINTPEDWENKLYKTFEEQNLDDKKNHLARFREIDGQIYMIGGWQLKTTSSRFFSKLEREYKNKIYKINPVTSFQFGENNKCPDFAGNEQTQTTNGGDYGEKIFGDDNETPQSIKSLQNNNGVIDMMKIGSETYYVVRGNYGNNGSGIYLWKQEGYLEKLDEEKYFFNSQVHCPTSTPEKCFYMISGGTKNPHFEDPNNLTNNDFLSEIKIYEIDSSGTVNQIINKLPNKLPQLTGYGTGRMLHQVILSGNDKNNLNIKIYGGYIIDQEDQGTVIGRVPNLTIKKTPNSTPDSVEKAIKEYEQDSEELGDCSDTFRFDPSSFMKGDFYNYYEWRANENGPNWHFFNFSIGEIYPEEEDAYLSLFGRQEDKNKIYEYPLQKDFKSESNTISITFDNFEWAWKYGCHHKCGRPGKCCNEGHFVKINGKSNIDTYYTYAKDNLEINKLNEGNMKINLNPIQSLSNNNKLSFSGNFDFSKTDKGGKDEEKYWNNKKFLGAVILEDNDGNGFLDKELLDKIFAIENKELKPVQYQPVEPPENQICVETDEDGKLTQDSEKPSTSANCNEHNPCPQIPSLKSPWNFDTDGKPQIRFDKNLNFKINEDVENVGIMKRSENSNDEKGSFFLEKEFEPGWHRVHLLVAALANPERQSLILQSDMGVGFMGKYNTWRWGKHSGVMSPETLGTEYEQIGFNRIFYRAFVYEFYVPEISNINTEEEVKIYGNEPTFMGKYVPNNSQMIFYSGNANEEWESDTANKTLFRLNDIAQNTPKIYTGFSFNSTTATTFSDEAEKTSNKIKSIAQIIKNTKMHHKIRSSKISCASSCDEDDAIGTFDYKPIFNFEKNKKQNFYYGYVDGLGNTIFGKELEFEIKDIKTNSQITLNEHLEYYNDQNGNKEVIINKVSGRPIISGYYLPEREIRALIYKGGKIIDEIIMLTKQNGEFEFKINKNLEGTNGDEEYNLIFLNKKMEKMGDLYKLKINKNSDKIKAPEIVNIKNGDIVFSKNPIFYGNGKAGKKINIEIFTEKQDTSSEIKCKERISSPQTELPNTGSFLYCNKYGTVGDTQTFFSPGPIDIDDNGNWKWELTKDLVNVENDSKNIYFIKTYYNLQEDTNYDIKSFRYFPETEENLSDKITSGSGDIVTINEGILEIKLKREKNDFKNDYSEIKFLEKGTGTFKGEFGAIIPPFGKLKINKPGKFSLEKGFKLFSGEEGIGKVIEQDEENFNLENGDYLITDHKSLEIIFKGDDNSESELEFPAGTLFFANESEVEIKTKKIEYFSKDSIDKLSFFDCEEIFDETGTDENRENCLASLSTIFNNNKVKTNKNFKITNIKNGQILLSGNEKYLIQGNAWPNAKIKISVNSIPVGGTTTNTNGQFLFRLPEGFEKGDSSVRTARIRIDNSDIKSQSIEFFVLIKNHFGEFESINPNKFADENTFDNDYKDIEGNINNSIKINKFPSYY